MTGAWVGGGQLQEEPARKYEIVVDPGPAFAFANEIERYVKSEFRQEAVYVKMQACIATKF